MKKLLFVSIFSFLILFFFLNGFKSGFSKNRITKDLSFCAPVWSPSKRVTWNSGLSHNPSSAVDDSDKIYLVWSDATSGDQEIYFRCSTDGGSNWKPLKRLTWTTGSSLNPSIDVDSNDILHVSFSDNSIGNHEIFYKTSTDAGLTWPIRKRLTWNSGESSFPKIGVDSSHNIHIFWSDPSPGNPEIFYRNSTDNGITWSSKKRLTGSIGNSNYPCFTIGTDDSLHLTYEDDSSGNNEIYYKRSTDGGMTWLSRRISWTDPGNSRNSSVATQGTNNIYVVWQDDYSGNNQIFIKFSTDGGNSWSFEKKRLTWTSGVSSYPMIKVKDCIHIVWQDDFQGNFEIYNKFSTDGGINWTFKRLTWNSGNSQKPCMVMSSNKINVFWHDSTSGNNEIFYRGAN